jgi:putative pyoverdin transport system ATP-binding/permease protein
MADGFAARFLFVESSLSRFLTSEATLQPRRAVAVAAIAGLSNALILALINTAAEHAEQSESRPLFAVAFGAAILIYMFAQRWILIQAVDQVEGIIHRVRMRIVRRLRDCELLDVEQLGRAVIYSGVARHTQTLSQSASTITIAIQMAVLIVFTTAYIAYLSLTSFFVLIAFMAVALSIYFRKSFSVRSDLRTTLEMDNGVYAAIDDLLNGFKEAKLSRRKTRAIIRRAEDISARASEVRGDTQILLAKNFVFSQTSFYLLLGTMVFIVPMLSSGYSDEVQKSTTAVLFIIGPIAGLIGSIPIFENASAAAEAIMDLEKRLADLSTNGDVNTETTDETEPVDDTRHDFLTLELRGAIFQFPATDGDPSDAFKIGPIDMTIKKGEALFITGGNGSGKSTLLRVLTGLYPLAKGQILLDGVRIRPSKIQDYRELFTAIFGDFHLSRHLDGVAPEHLAEADEWMKRLEIQDKVDLVDGVFSTADLSSGQRKRLALVASVLEHKPILVLDEWAADQDPMFRRQFYRDILPLLRERGHTIIAVTHDSRFFDTADRQLHMEDGMIADFDPDKFHD